MNESKAYLAIVENKIFFDEPQQGIYWAETASKARYKCYLHARDAGYYQIKLIEIQIKRYPLLDNDFRFRDGISVDNILIQLKQKTLDEKKEPIF